MFIETLAVFAVAVGALSQRLTGMGFALVAGPLLVVLLGPLHGVMVTLLAGILVCFLIWARTRRINDWRIVRSLVLPAIPGMLLGSWIVSVTPHSQLQVGVGAVVILALLVSLRVQHYAVTVSRSQRTTGIAGSISGFMNVTAAVGGPAVSVYAVVTRLDHRLFIAVMQPYFIALDTGSIVMKALVESDPWPPLGPWTWVAIFASAIGGYALGEFLARRVNTSIARKLMIMLAFAGGVSSIATGLVNVLGR